MARANPTTHQYEPLRVPGNWGPEERKLILQLTDVFDDIYRRYGRLRMEDLAPNVRKVFKDTAGNLLEIRADVDQVQLTLTTVQGDVSSLTLTTQEFATRLQTAEGDLSALEQTAQQFGVRLQNAEDDVTTLEATAQGLQTSVTNLGNTKNRTYINAIAPSVGLIAGDLWIDTANGNLLKRYNGSAWVAVQDGAISIAQQQADKIQWLVASGTAASNMELTDRLYTLVTNRVMITAQEQIELSVGGARPRYANMLRNTGYVSGLDGWSVWTSNGEASLEMSFSDIYGKNVPTIRNINTVSAYLVIPLSRNARVVAGQTYTVSFRAHGARPLTVYLYSGSTIIASKFSVSPENVLSNGWSEYAALVTASESTDYTKNARINIVFDVDPEQSSRWVDLVQMEPGAEHTPWTPATDDELSTSDSRSVNLFPLYEIDWAQGSLNEAQNGAETVNAYRIRSGHVTVTGGTQYTLSRFLDGDVFYIFYNSAGNLVLHSGAWVTNFPHIVTAPSTATTIRFVLRNANNSAVLPSEVLTRFRFSFSPAGGAGLVKTSKVTIDNTGIDMTTGGTFTTTSQNFNIDAAGNVVMKGTVEASAGKIAGFSMSGGMLIDTATNGMNLELDPANGVLDVGMMRITKYGTSDGFDLFYQGSQSGVCRVYSGSKSLNLTSKVGGTERSISIGDGIFLFGNTYFKDSAFGYHAGSYVPMLNSKNWLNYIYPVGAIYMSSASTSPGTLFGGTWTAITNPPTGAGYWWKRTG